jgi:hypothetical protein
MPIKFLRRHWQKVLLSITGLIVLFISMVIVGINFYWSPRLDQKLRTTVLTSTDSLYSIDFSKANLHVLQGKIVIDNLVLQPNITVYNRKKKAGLAPNSLYEVKIRQLQITHIHPFSLYFSKKLDIDQLVISEPDVTVNYEQNRDQDTVVTNKKTPYQLISKALKAIHVQSILLDDVKLKYIDHSSTEPVVSEFKELNFTATDFQLDSLKQDSKQRFLFCSDISVELNNYEGVSTGKRYAYKIEKVRFSTRTSELKMSGMSFAPAESATEFFKKSKADYYVIKLDSLRLNNFDYKAYSKFHKLFATHLTLNNGSVHIYSNPVPTDTTVDRSPSFPQLQLKTLKMDVKVDTVNLSGIAVLYSEYNEKSRQTGNVSFDNISGTFANITNNKAALQKNNIATGQLRSYLMNAALLNTNFSFKLDDDNGAFTYKGSLGPMELKKINPVAMPLGMIKIASGKAKSFDFDMQADRKMATGKACILYNDLRIAILKRDSDNSLKKMSIASLLANAMVIKRDNPTGGATPRVAKVVWLRKPSSSIFTFMWRSLFKGLKECAGYDARTEQTVKQKVVEFKANKLTRGIRKAERLQRRAKRKAKRALKQQRREAAKAAKVAQVEEK